jgi:hypothetical protein
LSFIHGQIDAARRKAAATSHSTLHPRSPWNNTSKNTSTSTSHSSMAASPFSSHNSLQQQSQIFNPYKKNHQQQHYPNPSSSNEQQAKRLLTEQYPHRAGRIRVDRQFTTSLSIGTCSNSIVQENENEWNRATKRRRSLDSLGPLAPGMFSPVRILRYHSMRQFSPR